MLSAAAVVALLLLLLLAPAAVAPFFNISFCRPVVVGHSNRTHFYFPAVAVALPSGEAALHVTLSDDSYHCPPNCAQVWRSKGGVSQFELQSTVGAGGSGSFNYYGDLGELIPGVDSSSTTFTTLAGNNGGDWLGSRWVSSHRVCKAPCPVVLQHWQLSPTLHITHNTSAVLTGTPPQFRGTCSHSRSGPQQNCGLAQGGKIVRDAHGVLLAAFGGVASDGPALCTPDETGWDHCYTLAFYRSSDNGSCACDCPVSLPILLTSSPPTDLQSCMAGVIFAGRGSMQADSIRLQPCRRRSKAHANLRWRYYRTGGSY
jgi:hypothetical protein